MLRYNNLHDEKDNCSVATGSDFWAQRLHWYSIGSQKFRRVHKLMLAWEDPVSDLTERGAGSKHTTNKGIVFLFFVSHPKKSELKN